VGIGGEELLKGWMPFWGSAATDSQQCQSTKKCISALKM